MKTERRALEMAVYGKYLDHDGDLVLEQLLSDAALRIGDLERIAAEKVVTRAQERDEMQARIDALGCERDKALKERDYWYEAGVKRTEEGMKLRAERDALRKALKSIILRCKEGDPRSDWLPVIDDIARKALEAGETRASA